MLGKHSFDRINIFWYGKRRNFQSFSLKKSIKNSGRVLFLWNLSHYRH